MAFRETNKLRVKKNKICLRNPKKYLLLKLRTSQPNNATISFIDLNLFYIEPFQLLRFYFLPIENKRIENNRIENNRIENNRM